MTFKEAEIDNFLSLFYASKEKIRNFEGCQHLSLLKDYDHPNIMTTYSIWKDQSALNQYRQSALFKEVWSKTKVKFDAKPVAFSLEELVTV